MQFVYALCHPVTSAVMYIGVSDNVYVRFLEHLACRDANSGKRDWIQGLKREGLLPGVKILDITEKAEQIKERELYWIRHYTEQGASLLNSIPTYKYAAVVSWRNPDKLVEALESVRCCKIGTNGKKWTYYRVANESGVNYGHVHRIFHGQTLPSREILLKICDALDCSYEKIIEIFSHTDYRAPTYEEYQAIGLTSV